MKELLLLFLGSALFYMSVRCLLRKQRSHATGKSTTSRPPHSQQAVFHTLSTLLGPACAIDCQVRLTDIFEIRPERGRQPLFQRIDGLYLDFLLADAATGLPLCGISLDDHLPRDPIIDRLFNSHDLMFLRIPRKHLADPATLRAAIVRLNRPAPRHSPPRSGARDSG